MELDIRGLMGVYNRIVAGNTDEGDVFVCSRLETSPYDEVPGSGKKLRDVLGEDKLPSACVGCGQCMFACPEGIGIPAIMHELVVLDT